MAGGTHPKAASSHNSSPSPSSSHRKSSRLESDKKPSDKKPSTITTTNTTTSSKSPTPKPTSNSKENPKPIPNPSPSHPKPPTDPIHRPGFGPIPPGVPPPPIPPPSYGFHMLERRTIALADGSVRSFFALPPDYKDFTTPPRPMLPPQGGLGFGRGFPPLGPMSPEFRDREDPFARDRNSDYLNLLKRKGGGDGDERGGRDGINDELARQRQHLLQYGSAGSMNPNRYPVGGLDERGEFMAGPSYNPDVGRGDEFRAAKFMRVSGGYENFRGGGDNVGLKHNDVDQNALKKAFLHFVKLLNENPSQKKNYLENGKQAPLQCIACGRSSKEFPDMHGLILHTYNPDKADLLVDHLGLHKALCVLMGWNYSKPPDSSGAYQSLSADEAAANQDDLIMWPPTVLIHNTHTGKVKDGRLEGLGNKAMDNILRGLGFGSGKAKSVFGREGHLGVVRVQFAGDQSGLKEALRLAEFLQKENCGRMNWARIHSLTAGKDMENDPNLVKVDEKTGEKARILYGYLGTAWDLDKVDFETRKKTAIESQREYKPS